jgi:two-component system, sensor histidine kinase ChiS
MSWIYCKIFTAGIIISCLTDPSFSQSGGNKFDQISIEQGLSQSTVYAILQDNEGFMWFGTQDGLNRYDGYSVTVFKNNPDDSNSLSDNTVWSLLSDSKGNLWIGTMRGGLNCYNLHKNKFIHYKHDENDPSTISENDVTSLFEDSKGNIWAGTRSRGLNRLNISTGKFERFQYNENDKSSISNNAIRTITEDKKGNLWIATGRGISRLNMNGTSGEASPPVFERYYNPMRNKDDKTDNNIRRLYIDKKGTIWVGTWGSGLYTFNINSSRFTAVEMKKEKGITAEFISAVYEDSDNNLWISTFDSGFFIYNRSSRRLISHESSGGMTLYEDRSGIMWLGTFTGGVKVYDKRKNRFRHYYDPDVSSRNLVQAILEDKDGELWIGTYGGGLKRFRDRERGNFIIYTNDPLNSRSIIDDKVFTLFQSSDGAIWIGTDGGLNRFDKERETFIRYPSFGSELILALNEDSKGNIWIGNSSGITIYRKESGTFERNQSPKVKGVMTIYRDGNDIWVGTLRNGVHLYKNSDLQKSVSYYPLQEVLKEERTGSSINNSSVISILRDNKGIIWMGTYGGGLNRFDTVNENFKYYTVKDGLPNDVVYGILPDKQGLLWLSTNKGISRFNPETGTFRNYDAKDGLQGNEFNQGSYFVSNSGELFFGGVYGFNAFDPDQIKDNKFVPPVYLTAFKVFDEVLPLTSSLSATKRIELSYFQNFFSFEFVALNYTSPEKNNYKYMLEGFEKAWHNVSAERRYASYTNLDPGEYTLRVKGSNNDGIWNEAGTSIAIVIKPPFWKTLWFRVSAVLIIISIIVMIYKYRVNQLLKIEQMRVRIASDLHDEIGSSLGSIVLRSRVLQKETKWSMKSKAELERIHNTAMQTASAMRDIVWFVNPDFDTLDDMILRMKDITQSLISCIPYEFAAPDEVLSVKIPLEFRRNIFLSYQEILHNISKHSQAAKVKIDIKITGNLFSITVVDNGIGFTFNESSRGNGLKNMQKRIAGIDGEIKIFPVPGEGTTIIITAKTT